MIAMREPSKFLFMSGGFFEELQRRKVYRVAAAYIIAAGFIIQMGSAVFPAWELPNWTFRLVVVLLLIGFPIALILAWAFDVTPEGIQATPKTAAETHLRRNMIILIATGVIISAVAGFFLLSRGFAHKLDPLSTTANCQKGIERGSVTPVKSRFFSCSSVNVKKVSNGGLSPGEFTFYGLRFGQQLAANDKKVPDTVGSEVFVLHKFVLTIPYEAGRSCLTAAANMKRQK